MPKFDRIQSDKAPSGLIWDNLDNKINNGSIVL